MRSEFQTGESFRATDGELCRQISRDRWCWYEGATPAFHSSVVVVRTRSVCSRSAAFVKALTLHFPSYLGNQARLEIGIGCLHGTIIGRPRPFAACASLLRRAVLQFVLPILFGDLGGMTQAFESERGLTQECAE